MPDVRRRLGAAFAVATLALSGCAYVYRHYPFAEVRDVAALETRVRAAVAASQNLSLRTLGHVTYRDRRYALWLVSYSAVPDPRYHILISAGIHGDEPAGVEAAVQTIEAMARGEPAFSNAQVDVVPLVNPWGWIRDLRVNGDGLDINRDFVDFETDEADILKALLCRQRYDLTLDLHEDSRHDGFYSYAYDETDAGAAPALAQELAAGRGVPLRRVDGNDGFIRVTRPDTGRPHKPTLAWYARTHVTRRAYILETPSKRNLTERVALHRFGIGFLANRLATAPEEPDNAAASGVGACAVPGRRSGAR
jgi:protein MpaA